MPTKRVSQTALLVPLSPTSNLPGDGKPHFNNNFASLKFYVTRHCPSPQKFP